MSGLGLSFKLRNSTALQCEAQGTPEQQEGACVHRGLSNCPPHDRQG